MTLDELFLAFKNKTEVYTVYDDPDGGGYMVGGGVIDSLHMYTDEAFSPEADEFWYVAADIGPLCFDYIDITTIFTERRRANHLCLVLRNGEDTNGSCLVWKEPD